jgi:hypothetical protein
MRMKRHGNPSLHTVQITNLRGGSSCYITYTKDAICDLQKIDCVFYTARSGSELMRCGFAVPAVKRVRVFLLSTETFAVFETILYLVNTLKMLQKGKNYPVADLGGP